MSYHHQHSGSAGPSRLHDEKWFALGGEHNINDTAPSKRDAGHGHGHGSGTSSKRRKDISGKLGKEMSDRRDDSTRNYAEITSSLHAATLQICTKPETHPLFNLRLLPLTIERSSLLVQIELEEKYELECAEVAFQEERDRVEEEWKRGRDRVRERLLEGIEERRRKAREEKEGEGAVAESTLDSQSRQHITRKLRNKLGTSPPPTPLGLNHPSSLHTNGIGLNGLSGTPGLGGVFGGGAGLFTLVNPHSLSVDDIPSPFPLPLTSTQSSSSAFGHGAGSALSGGSGGPISSGPGGGAGRRRPKGSGTQQSQGIGGLGKSLTWLTSCKEAEMEADLNEIRRGNKRRRAAANSLGKTLIN